MDGYWVVVQYRMLYTCTQLLPIFKFLAVMDSISLPLHNPTVILTNHHHPAWHLAPWSKVSRNYSWFIRVFTALLALPDPWSWEDAGGSSMLTLAD